MFIKKLKNYELKVRDINRILDRNNEPFVTLGNLLRDPSKYKSSRGFTTNSMLCTVLLLAILIFQMLEPTRLSSNSVINRERYLYVTIHLQDDECDILEYAQISKGNNNCCAAWVHVRKSVIESSSNND